MSQPGLNASEARAELYELMARDLPFEEKATKALELGEKYLAVDNGHLTRIEPESNFWKAIASTDPPDGQFPANLVLDLETTYCRRTIAQKETIALHDAPKQGWEADPAYLEHGVHCYHGTPIMLGDEAYGTVCFVSEEPRAEPFESDETLFAELLARMLEHELERQRAQDQIDRLDTFASAVSHDLRNPLNVAQMYVDAEREHLERESDDLTAAAMALDRMERLIEDVLSMARETESVEDPDAVSLAAIARESWETVDTKAAELQIEADTQLLADAGRLQRLFENIFRNAIEHVGPSVTVSVGPVADGEGFYIADDGPGIPPEKRDMIFDSGYTEGGAGIGLGLAIVESIVSAHEWSIEVTESDAGGARFEITDVIPASWN